MNQNYLLLILCYCINLSLPINAQVTLEMTYPTIDLHRVNWKHGGEKYWYFDDTFKVIRVYSAQHQLLKTIRYPSVNNVQVKLLSNEQAVSQTTVNSDDLLELVWFFKDTLTKREQMKIINERDSILFVFNALADNVSFSEIEGLPSKLFISAYENGIDAYTTKVFNLPTFNLENIYFRAYRLHRKKFGYAGEKYFYKDDLSEKMRIFNPDHSFWKNINLTFQNITLYNNDGCTDADDNVFSKDSLVEVVFCYEVGINSGKVILSENGRVIHKVTTNNILLDRQNGLPDKLFEEVYSSTSDNYFRFYSLPEFKLEPVPIRTSRSLGRILLKKFGEIFFVVNYANQLLLFYNNNLNKKTINLAISNSNNIIYPSNLYDRNFPIISDSIINRDSLIEVVYTQLDTNKIYTTKIVNDTGFVYKTIDNTRFFSLNHINGLRDKLMTQTGNNIPFETKIWRFEAPTAIKETPSVFDVRIYPNPFLQDINIETEGSIAFPLTIRLINALGEVVFNTKAQNNKVHLSVPNLSIGVYFMEVNNGNKRTIRKIVKMGF